MASTTRSNASRVRKLWNQLKYANRRSFEIRTGVPVLRPEERPRLRGSVSVEELEALFAWDEPRLRGC